MNFVALISKSGRILAHEQEFRTGPKLKRMRVDLSAGWPGGMSPRLGQGLCCEAVRTQVLKLGPGGVPAWGQRSAKELGPGAQARRCALGPFPLVSRQAATRILGGAGR